MAKVQHESGHQERGDPVGFRLMFSIAVLEEHRGKGPYRVLKLAFTAFKSFCRERGQLSGQATNTGEFTYRSRLYMHVSYLHAV